MKRTLLAWFCFGYFTSLFGINDIAFKHLGVSDGLSDSQINHITKDSQGFMWFSTSYGLNRYDGYTFKLFTRKNKTPNSLPDNFIDNVQEDANGLLWVHTSRLGYVYYNPEKETFHPVGPYLLEHYGIPEEPTLLYIDKDKNMWFYREFSGTYYYNNKDKKTRFYPASEAYNKKGIIISCFAEDKEGVVCVYNNGCIERFDPASDQIAYRNDFLIDKSEELSWHSIFIDPDGDYWIYASMGVWVYYIQEDRWEFLSTDAHSPYILSGNFVKDIKNDHKKNIWIATDHGGISIINKRLHTIEYVKNDLFNERSIIQNSLNCLYYDDDGSMWIGSYKRGISYYNESIFKFKTDHLSKFGYISNFSADINAIVEDKDANLWIGTNSCGLIYWSHEDKDQKIYQHSAGQNSLSGDVIVSMIKARDGKLWIGTYRNGLNSFDGNKFTHYRHDPQNPNSLANDNIWALAEGDNGYIWIGTLGSGLQGLDPHTGTFTQYPKEGFDKEYINCIHVGKDGNLYMGTSYGIAFFSPATGVFEKWQGNKKGTQEFSHNNVNYIYEDSRGLLWIATLEGLNIYDRKKDEIKTLTDELGLENNIINAIVEDNNRNMWVTTLNSMLNVVVHIEPATGVYSYTHHSYNELDGLQGQQFNPHSMIKTFRGEIIAGGIGGLTSFMPENLKYNHNIPKVKFTGLQLFNKEVKIDSVYKGNLILEKPLNLTSEIRLTYSQNVFSVNFSAMNYVLPEKTKYMYMLKGFNSEWLTTDDNKLTYTNLMPGQYTLKVKAVNGDGFGSHEASELKIIIEPPFWASPIAYALYLLLVIGILFLTRKQILRNEHQKYELKQIEQEAQQKHEIDDMKLRFFTNISHELRTPLTLIISPLENVIKNTEHKEQKNKLEMVHRNAMRLLNMVNQLLDFRKSDVKGHQLIPSQGDIVEFIQAISNSFIEYSEKKNVHLTFFTSVRQLLMVFDEDKINKIMMNLLSNAFKYTPDGERVDIHLSLLPAKEDEPEKFEIKITDTGIGIDEEDKERIFERFYQINRKEGQKSGGSGIGLHLVKEFVSLHGGTITVHDNIGQGSVFIVTLPVIRTQAAKTQETETPTEAYTQASPSSDETILVDEPQEDPANRQVVILVVDDNDDFRTFMKDSLKSEYVVKEASDGAKAWELIPTLQPDLIVSDVMMPEPDGNELCKLVKTDIRTSHIPLILLTARSTKEQKLEGLESGADDYITKPFDFDILTLRIKKLLQQQQKRQENFHKHIEVTPSEITITSLDEKLIKNAIQYVEENMERSEFSVEELSRMLGMSRVHLYKKMLSVTGKTPIEFIRTIRLKRAAQFLRESQQTISEISYNVGFSDPKYFRKYFKDEFGVLPSEYQEKEGI